MNVDKEKTIRNAILARMDIQTIAESTFKKKDKATTLSSQFSVKIGGEAVQVDPRLLFQRFTVAAKASVFKYGLCSNPPALFDTSLLLRQPHKLVLTSKRKSK
ncbi:hypothetical protein MAR_019413 [Mya arenaria]|uniref:Uncharacterized protein n=1 Tax=Mya arenaria TaxID=6604 RepID=A0ABY7EHH6_MYAAR|nr:hypothetical protein MAR_019413 [Mya arenaria]